MPATKDTTQEDAAMQDAELFFQAADHRLLFLFIDGLAETEARRQADVCNYVKKHLDDYEALQKKVERLEQELQQEAVRRQADADDYAALQKEVKRLEQELQQKKDACALLQKQLAQQNSEAAVHSSQKTTTEDKQAGTAPAQDSAEYWYRLGEQYACGIGVPRDDAKARQWYTKAAATFKKAAEQGDADAQFRLGDMYKKGKGVPQNNGRACQWYAKAAAQRHKTSLSVLKQLAEQGHADAQLSLGDMYANGIGVPRDDDRALQWYAKAARQSHKVNLSVLKQLAEQGHADAQFRLGDRYKEGKGVPRDGGRARQWYTKAAATFKKAAEQGDADAQFSLGDMYKKGKGVPRDDDMACQWYAEAAAQGHDAGLNALKQLAEQGDAAAQYHLGTIYKEGKGVLRSDDMACQWYAKAAAQGHDAGLNVLKQLAEQGDADAQYRLGTMYKEGKSMPQDSNMACQWYAEAAAQGHEAGLSVLKQLAEQGDAAAQYRLGDMYKKGKGVPRDDDRARQWYTKAAVTLKKAAEQGHAEAQFCLGEMYKEGKSMPRDGDIACQWYAKAAAQGQEESLSALEQLAKQRNVTAQFCLGKMYDYGKGVPQDDDRARQWYAEAAEQGHADAQFCLGDMYNYGEGVPRNGDMACQWYAKAAAQGHKAGLNALKQLAEQGNADAQFRLDNMYKKAKASRGTATSLARGMQKPPRRGRKKA